MGLRDDLLKRIERKRHEMASLEAQIKETKIYVQALEDTLRMLPRERQPRDYLVSPLRPGSYITKARDALHKAGKPLHIQELLSSIGKDATPEARAAVAGSLSAYVRRGEIFARPAPNTFGLIEWEDAEAEGKVTSPDNSEPPAGFGEDGQIN